MTEGIMTAYNTLEYNSSCDKILKNCKNYKKNTSSHTTDTACPACRHQHLLVTRLGNVTFMVKSI